ncbi:MAG TPA: erythromycin esterase family protein, partial [Pyrinomonadaceae bacterium]|nr:erythromycin esterase family protein [Pyrinomonadaceae bacterium]
MYTRPLARLLAVCLAAFLLHAPAASAQEKPAASAAEPDPVTAWLTAQAVPLRGVEPGRGFDDLKPLKKILGDARVVGLGEMTHGSREFFQLKHRLVEFLVREMGFTVFALEASHAATLKINDYVLHGKGARARALAGQGLWVWDTNELTDLVEWMRAYNRTAPEASKVKFLGFDIQNNEQSMDALAAYLRRVAPERVAPAEAAFKPLRPRVPFHQNIEYNAVGAEEKAQTLARLRELVEFLTQNQSRLARQTSAAEFEDALQHARVLAQFADAYSGGQT